MFDDLLKANEATLIERFITRCVAPSLLLTALFHAETEDLPPYLFVEPNPPIPTVGTEPLIRGDPPLVDIGWPTFSDGPARRIQSRRSPRAPLLVCCARSTTAPAGSVSSAPRCPLLTGLSSFCNVPPTSGKGCFCTISDSQRASEAARCSTP